MDELLKGNSFLDVNGIASANSHDVTKIIVDYKAMLLSSRDDPLKQGLPVSSISNPRHASH